MASDEDRALVSGILWKRIEIGMPLQVDATITYIKNQGPRTKNQGNGKILLADTKIDSPYNTYRYRGLPKGPIANPGMSAIRAAIYPKESSYLYYLSTPEGKTIFSRTLEEHNIARRDIYGKPSACLSYFPSYEHFFIELDLSDQLAGRYLVGKSLRNRRFLNIKYSA